MDPNLLTVVSGEPRSGTSLMMQTLELLGAPVAGHKFPQEERSRAQTDAMPPGKERDRAEAQAAARLAQTKKMNPRGFYELPGIVMGGLRHMRDDLKGHAIKIVTNGLYEREQANGQVAGTPLELIDKIILCVRDPRHIAVSQKDLSGGVEVAAEGIDQWVNMPRTVSPLRTVRGLGSFLIWLAADENLDAMRPKILVVDYETMHSHAAQAVDDVARFLGLKPKPGQLAAAVANVEPLLRRATDFAGWQPKDAAEGDLAERIYGAMKELKPGDVAGLAAETEDALDTRRLEVVRWVDDAHTWVGVTAQLYRWMLADRHGVGTNLSGSLRGKRQAGLIPDACPYWGRDPEHTYSIERPADLGPLVRPMVKCGRDNKLTTVEGCKLCWQRGSVVDGIEFPPQMQRGGK